MEQIKIDALAAIDDVRGSIIDLAEWMRGTPEIGYQEYQAASALVGFLRSRGFATESGIAGMPTAFRAQAGAGRPAIAILAEYDALPEIGHGCGHNLIAAGAVGAAVGVARVIGQMGGTVWVIGTPAEECMDGVPGKVRLLDAGAFDGIDAVVMYHPCRGENTIVAGSKAVTSFEVAFHGRAAHASADPWNGANALDGVMLTFNAMSALRQQMKPEARVHWKVTDGGDAPNVIHSHAAALITVRAEDQAYLDNDLLPRIENCARGAGLATGTTVGMKRVMSLPSVRRNSVLERTIMNAAGELDIEFGDPLFLGGSSDFGHLSRVLPASMILMQIGLTYEVPWHSQVVVDACGRQPAFAAMVNGARIMALTIIDLLRDPSLVADAGLEFAAES